MKILFLFGILYFVWFSRRFSRTLPDVPRVRRHMTALFCALFTVIGAVKPPYDPGNGGMRYQPGDGKLPPHLTPPRGNNWDSDGDGVPDSWEDRVFMDKEVWDSDSRQYDAEMTALEKYQATPSLDWRVIDTGADGISDAWKLYYGLLPVSDNIGKLIATNGLTFYQSYIRGLNPMLKTQNPQNLPLTDFEVVALGYSPFDVVPPSATNAVAGDVTIVRLGMSGAGVPYARLRAGPAVHAGRAPKDYALRSGEIFTVEVERLPGKRGGAGLPVEVSMTPVRGIATPLPGFTGQFTVPEESGGSLLLPMSASLQNTEQFETWRLLLSAEREGCIHGTCKVTATVLRPSGLGVPSAGDLKWSWVEGKNYGILPFMSPNRAITVGMDEDAYANWKAYKAVHGAGARQALEGNFILYPNLLMETGGRIVTAEAIIRLGCCLAYEDKPDENECTCNPHVDCDCGPHCHCGGCTDCHAWAGCGDCFSTEGVIITNTVTGAGIHANGLRFNNNWDVGGMLNGAPAEDRNLLFKPSSPTDPDLFSATLMDAAHGDCCVCKEHGPHWRGQITAITANLKLYDEYLFPVGVGQAYSKNNSPSGFYVEGFDPGGWNKSHYIAWTTEQLDIPNSLTFHTNYYVAARADLFGDHLQNGNVTASENRRQWHKRTRKIVDLIAGGFAEAIGMGIWAGSHNGGRAHLTLVGNGHFEVGQSNVLGVAWSLTNGQSRAWNATADGTTELYVRCYAPGTAELQLTYTNAVAPGFVYRSVLKLEGTAVHSIEILSDQIYDDKKINTSFTTGLLAQCGLTNLHTFVELKTKDGAIIPANIPLTVHFTVSEGANNIAKDDSFQYTPGHFLGKKDDSTAKYWSATVGKSIMAGSTNSYHTTAHSAINTATNDQGKAYMTFLPSGVGGDTFTLTASVTQTNSTIILATTNINLTVWRKVKFDKIWQMTNADGTKETHVVDNAIKDLIQRFFSETAQTYVEYECDVSNVTDIPADKSVEYIGLWVDDPSLNYQLNWAEIQQIIDLPGDPQNEKPTQIQWNNATKTTDDQERRDARAEIIALAQKWTDRIHRSYRAARTSWAGTMPENTIVAIKYYHPKYSGTNTNYQTSEWGDYDWLKITIPGTTEPRPPDSWWLNVGGTSYARGVVSIPKGEDAGVIQKIIAHETGHATRHHFKRAFFGDGISGNPDFDHSDQGLMFPRVTSPQSDDKFSQPETNILKGEKKP